jgi:predicted nucleic acid-binding protein
MQKIILDANAILRYVIDDIKEQADAVENILQDNDVLILPEVMAEVVYVLTKWSGKADSYCGVLWRNYPMPVLKLAWVFYIR